MAVKTVGTNWNRDTRNTIDENDKNLQRQINDLVLSSGDSNAEVVQARGGERTLNDRLNKMTNSTLELEKEIEKKRDKSVLIGLNDLDGETISAIEGGEQTEFNLLSIPKDQSVSPNKTTFIKMSSNLFNYLDVTVGLIGEDGTIDYDRTDYHHSGFISVNPNTDYTFRGITTIACYDETMNFITRLTTNQENNRLITRTMPNNCYFIRVNYQHNNFPINITQINEGSELLEWEPYYNYSNIESVQSMLLNDSIPNTTQGVEYNDDGDISKVIHTRDEVVIRTDVILWGNNEVTETRTLHTGDSITITTNLQTLETVVS